MSKKMPKTTVSSQKLEIKLYAQIKLNNVQNLDYGSKKAL